MFFVVIKVRSLFGTCISPTVSGTRSHGPWAIKVISPLKIQSIRARTTQKYYSLSKATIRLSFHPAPAQQKEWACSTFSPFSLPETTIIAHSVLLSVLLCSLSDRASTSYAGYQKPLRDH
jgi:hypothetical protein